jgi:hypothetical protein
MLSPAAASQVLGLQVFTTILETCFLHHTYKLIS